MRAQHPSRPPWLAVLFASFVVLVSACTDPINQAPPEIVSFTSVRGVDGAITLSWAVVGAESLKLSPGSVDVNGSQSTVVYPDETTTYVLVARNPMGTTSRSLVVPVGPVPTIASFEAAPVLVNPGEPVTFEWSVDGADTITLRGPGIEAGIDVTGSNERTILALAPGATYTLAAENAFGAVEHELQVARLQSAVSVLVAGQSNAMGVNIGPLLARAFITAADGVMMLGNDYVWKPASEPLDDCTDQVDQVSGTRCASLDDPKNGAGVSPGVALGNGLNAATGGEVFLIPAASGGSRVSQWLPGTNPYDRTTLFGSAAYRARLAGTEQGAPFDHEFNGASYGAVFWFQGEDNADTPTDRQAFATGTPVVLNAFQEELGAAVILAQLGGRRGPTFTTANLRFQVNREVQRMFETGARAADGAPSPQALERTYLVVTHDLPLSDGLHLTEFAQLELGRRISLAVREHLLGHDVDGTGPRLQRVEFVANTVLVHLDVPVTPPASTGSGAYSGYFAVLVDGAPRAIDSIVRDDDPAVIRIALAEPITGDFVVRYMPPPTTIGSSVLADVVRSRDCDEPMPVTNLCLPLPAFGYDAVMSALSGWTVPFGFGVE